MKETHTNTDVIEVLLHSERKKISGQDDLRR